MNESLEKIFQDFRQVKENLSFIINPLKAKVTKLEFHLFGIEIIVFEMQFLDLASKD